MRVTSVIAPLLVAGGLALTPMASANAASPVFGKAQHVALSSEQMNKVSGSGVLWPTTTATWA